MFGLVTWLEVLALDVAAEEAEAAGCDDAAAEEATEEVSVEEAEDVAVLALLQPEIMAASMVNANRKQTIFRFMVVPLSFFMMVQVYTMEPRRSICFLDTFLDFL